MAELTIHDLDDSVIKLLQARAETHDRSLQAEVRQILAAAVKVANRKALDRETFIQEARRIRAMTPDVPQTDSTKLIREDRDR